MRGSDFCKGPGGPLLALALALSLLQLPGCAVPDTPSLLVSPLPAGEEAGGRVSPVYEQWLYRQSMLAQATEASDAISGSPLVFRHTASRQDCELLLEAAPVWLVVDVARLSGPGLVTLAEADSIPAAGLWLARACEADTVWVPGSQTDVYRQASLRLRPGSGGEEALTELGNSLRKLGVQSGMTAMPTATGLGPDFMLQARGSERQRGMYVMYPVPDNRNALLPEAHSPWDCQPLDAAQTDALRQEGIIPGPLEQERQPADTLWAVTGPVLGVDGQTRRWIYRASGSPWRPVLCWQDPGLAARRALQGAIVLTTGLRRQTLTGLDLTGLAGLDRDAGDGSAPSGSPAPQALRELGQQVRRLGGWSLVTAGHDISLMRTAFEDADFWLLPGLDKALEKALDSGDASELADLMKSLLTWNIPVQRIAFTGALPGSRQTSPLVRDVTDDTSRADLEKRFAHLAMALPCALPGLAFLDGGMLPGYGPTARPGHNALARLLEPVLAARRSLHLASGTLAGVLTPSSSSLAIITSAPSGRRVLTLLNFSHRPLSCALAVGTQAQSLTPDVQAPVYDGGRLHFTLKACQAAHYLLDTSLSAFRQECPGP